MLTSLILILVTHCLPMGLEDITLRYSCGTRAGILFWGLRFVHLSTFLRSPLQGTSQC